MKSTEHLHFQWYFIKSSVKLPGAFYSISLTPLLYQACTIEPSLRYAITCLGSIHKQQVFAAFHDEALITEQYCLAIKSLRPYLNDGSQHSLRIALFICLLFVQMENLRGNLDQGMIHLEHGLQLLTLFKSLPSMNPLDGWLIANFTGLVVQAKLSDQMRHFACCQLLVLIRDKQTSYFRSIYHARRILESIFLRLFDLRDHSLLSNETEIQCALVDTQLESWLNTWTMLNQEFLTPQECIAYRILRMFHRIAVILAAVCTDLSDEAIWDKQVREFMAIIGDCVDLYHELYPNGVRRVVLDLGSESGTSISDIGWIAPLHFTAVNCRNPHLRRQAIDLLKIVPHREGLYSSELSVAIATEVMRTEEDTSYASRVPRAEALQKFDLDVLLVPDLPRSQRVNSITISQSAGLTHLTYCQDRQWRSRRYDHSVGTWSDTDAHHLKSSFTNSSLSFQSLSAAADSVAQGGA